MTMNDIAVLERENHTLRNEKSQLHHECEEQRVQIQRLTNENTQVKEENHKIAERCKELEDAKCKLNALNSSQASLSNDDSKVKYYTGLPSFAVLLAVFNLVKSGVEVTSRCVLSPFQQMILVLMKLRLNFGDQDLAFRFGVSQSTVSRCVGKWVDNLYMHLKPLIKWPERDQLLKTIPMDFKKNFNNCVTIIDFFEVFMERPSNLRARAQT